MYRMDENQPPKSGTNSWLIGILSVLPIVLMVNFLIKLFTGILPDLIRLTESGQDVSAADILHLFGPFFTIAILWGLLHMILLVWFIVHLMQDKTTTSNDRLVWLLLLIFLNPFSFPFYWYFRMYRPVSMGS
ncbi:MAG: PLDc N-terminal domain-containing protein [Chitinophagales bacterium]|nr:PLDc N-terminal domain-containing protein [Chitinophagales bacterium]